LVELKAVESLLKALTDGNSEARTSAARALGELKDPRALDPLIKALAESDSRVRAAAARRSAGLYVPCWAEDEAILAAAAGALGELKDPRAVEPLISVLGNSASDVRAAVVKALGELKDSPGVAEVLEAERRKLERPIPGVRYVEAVEKPGSSGQCSSVNRCPCSGTRIPWGEGYLLVNDAFMMAVIMCGNPKGLFGGLSVSPILMCEQAARLRGIDMGVAAADAKYWWETGKVPMRETPMAKTT
jgi:hypothetical protein